MKKIVLLMAALSLLLLPAIAAQAQGSTEAELPESDCPGARTVVISPMSADFDIAHYLPADFPPIASGYNCWVIFYRGCNSCPGNRQLVELVLGEWIGNFCNISGPTYSWCQEGC